MECLNAPGAVMQSCGGGGACQPAPSADRMWRRSEAKCASRAGAGTTRKSLCEVAPHMT